MTCRRASLLLTLALAAAPPGARAADAPAPSEARPPKAAPKDARAPAQAREPGKDASKDAAKEAERARARDKDAEREAAAGEARPRSGRLEDKIPPVSGGLFRKAGRFEITPSVGLSLGDAFFQKYLLGLKLAYHPAETLSAGAFGYYALDTAGGAVTVCRASGCTQPTTGDLTSVPGKLGVLAGAEVGWTPIYGKVNLFAEKVLHFDTGLVGGASLVQYAAPGGTMKLTAGGHLGISQRYFLSPSVTLRVELRDYLYSAQIVQLGDSNSKLENQLVLELGVSFFAGGSPRD